MNQKEFELIAGNLKDLKKFVSTDSGNPAYDAGKYDTLYILVNNLSNDLARTYPKTFDPDKFFSACGIDKVR